MKKLLLTGLLLCAAASVADERITSFHSDIRVFEDGMIEVTETIQVTAEGKQIRRGIYRDFPVEYKDKLGNVLKITVEPLALQRNGEREDYKVVQNNRDIRVYFGSSDRLLPHGVHTYVYRYRANRMLGFFEEHDELYWNVTGNRWAFPIDKASATVTLEFAAPSSSVFVEAYTGLLGSNAQQYSRFRDEAGRLHFSADGQLPPSHGLTIVVGWPKGLVEEPTALQRLIWLLYDNRNLLIAVLGLVLLLAYYIPVWKKHGKDPDGGVIVTRYSPPTGFSPASLRYIRQMYYDDKVMTAAVVNLAVKGYLEIKKRGDTHSIRKLESATLRPAMAPGERELYDALFAGDETVTLKQTNHKLLGKARSKHHDSLKADYKSNYFRTNGLLNIPAIIIVLSSSGLALAAGREPTPVLFAVIGLNFAIAMFFALIMKRPTLRGRKVLDEMLGFKDFLEIAEKEELNLRNPPEKTPELFESFLPFALALGVDQQWSERFAALLASIRTPDGKSYSPSWYNGSWNSSNLSKTTQGFTRGMSSAVASSTAAPGSSSGGGGGGSSGGGGGGGGGGGW